MRESSERIYRNAPLSLWLSVDLSRFVTFEVFESCLPKNMRRLDVFLFCHLRDTLHKIPRAAESEDFRAPFVFLCLLVFRAHLCCLVSICATNKNGCQKLFSNYFALHFLALFGIAVNADLWLICAQMMKTTKQSKPEILRARCTDDLKRNVERVASIQQLDEADIVRMACAAYVAKFMQPQMMLHG